MSHETLTQSRRKLIWSNILFFSATTLIAVIGAPLYLMDHAVSPGVWGLALFYTFATGMSITAGYHRLFAHRTFKAHPLVEFLVLFFGAAAFEQSALKWASQHRDHHRYVDTEADPYSIKKGFFYAHVGWLVFWVHPCHFENAKDLQENRMLMHQQRYYHVWAVTSGILLPLLIGAALGQGLAALIFAVCLRLTFVYHATFCINSVCHMFGKATYDIYSTAKDHWFVAFLTYGEGYHNFHHRFPSDYRNAIRWYQWDPTKWVIYALKTLGLARDLKKVSEFRILEARLAAQSQTARDWILKRMPSREPENVRLQLDNRYGELRHRLLAWEQAARTYHALLCRQITEKTQELRAGARNRLELAKMRFETSRREWQTFQRHQLGLVV